MVETSLISEVAPAFKTCTKCEISKELVLFSKYQKSKDGHASWCKQCFYQKKLDNPKKQQEYTKTYLVKNKDKREQYYQYAKKAAAKKYKTNINYRLASLHRCRIGQAVKCKKQLSSMKYLGCSFDELKKHIEAQFKEGMTWGNHKRFGWHIDHIIPLASFDLTKEENLKKAFHYSNLQPLWWNENLSKGSKIIRKQNV